MRSVNHGDVQESIDSHPPRMTDQRTSDSTTVSISLERAVRRGLPLAAAGLVIALAHQIAPTWAFFLALVAVMAGAGLYLARQSSALLDLQERLHIAEHRYASVLNFNTTDFDGKADLLQLTLNLMNQGVAVMRPDGRLWLYNKRALEYAGIEDPPFPCTTRRILEIQLANKEFGEDGELLPQSVRDFLFEGKGKPPKSYTRRRPNGTILEIRSDPMPDGSVIQTYTDITELARAKEAAEMAAKAKSSFLATMSHEIRTPLNGVLGAAQLMGRTSLTDDQQLYVETISSCAEALLVVINDILDFSKFESTGVTLENAPCDLARVFRDSTLVLEAAAEAKGLEILVQGIDDLPASVLADGKRIRQILINYLGNAVKFTDRGRVTLSAEVLPGENGPMLRATVTDTGIGIPPDRIAHLFREFAQVDDSISRRFGGTGLGLAISKKLAEAMGGRVGVTSRPGVGSSFFVEIPLVVSAEAPRAAKPEPTVVSRPRRVLVAEDIPTNQLVVKGMLEKLGHTVVLADNGAQALERLREATFDIVLLDMQMPVLDGISTARAIRAEARWDAMPLVAMTANIFASDREACLSAGMNDFLSKPVRQDQIASVIDQLTRTSAEVPSSQTEASARFRLLRARTDDRAVADLLDVLLEEMVTHLGRLPRALALRDVAGARAELSWLQASLAELGFETPAATCAAWLAGDASSLDGLAETAALLEEQIQAAIAEGRGDLALAA